jgi:hypothetical protein
MVDGFPVVRPKAEQPRLFPASPKMTAKRPGQVLGKRRRALLL